MKSFLFAMLGFTVGMVVTSELVVITSRYRGVDIIKGQVLVTPNRKKST